MALMKKEIKPGSKAHRSFQVVREAINAEARTVELAFSSEAPYERYWGREILDHSPQSIRLGRLSNGGPLLMDHDTRDHVAVIESVHIGPDRVGRAVVRFGKSARAEEVFQDVKDGIRRNVSVGYMIHKAQLIEIDDESGIDIYRVTDWEPYEVTLTACPADISVGVGRSADNIEKIEFIEQTEIVNQTEIKENKMPEVNVAEIETRGQQSGRDAEQKRAAEIIAIGEAYVKYGVDKIAAQAVREGWTVDQFREKAMEKLAVPPTASDIGMSEKEAGSFSFLRAINAMANPADRKAREAAAFEREASDAYAAKFGRTAQGFFIPAEVQRRDLTVSPATAGGHTVATNLLSANFIDLLRNRMMVMRMGAQLLSGLVGNVAIPRQTGGATAYWVAESGSPAESQQAFDQVAMSPKTIGAFTDLSRKLIIQSSVDVEGFVRGDLATVLGLGLDLAAINGNGAGNQPTGVLNVSGIGDVAGGANGLTPTWAHIIELWSDIANANADFGNMGMLTNSRVIGKLMGTLKSTGVAGYIVENFPDASGITNAGGARVGVSNQVPSNLTKGTSAGVCSAIINGNWSDLIIGNWGSLDLTVDPYTGSTSGTVRVIALQDADIAVRHPESFSAMKDALTA